MPNDLYVCLYVLMVHVLVAIDADLQTLLESTHTRNLFLDDLLELREFLNQRLQELTSENQSMLAFGQVCKPVYTYVYFISSKTCVNDTLSPCILITIKFGSGSEDLNVHSTEGVTEMLVNVNKVLGHLTKEKIHHLFLIKGSKRLVQTLNNYYFGRPTIFP